jgi:hypothetical protein
MLSISIPVDRINFEVVMESGRAYLLSVMEELGLKIPEFESE